VHATRFTDLLQTFDCVQHVREPTHRAGRTLDVVISRADTDVHQLSVGDFLSDHAVVKFKLSLRRPATAPQPVMHRRWRSFIAADFEADLSSSRLCTGLDNLDQLSGDELMEMYDSEMLLLLDKHCPRVAVKQKQCRLTPWFDAECRKSRRHVRVLERRYRRSRKKADKSAWRPRPSITSLQHSDMTTRLATFRVKPWCQKADKSAWLSEMKSLHALYEEKNRQYWRNETADSKGDSRKLWRTMSGIMGEKQTSSDSGGFTADEFASFFVDKVEAVRQSTSSTPLHHVSETAAHTMASWKPVTPDDVLILISNALNKSCQLDAAPTWLAKQYRGLIAPFYIAAVQ